LIFKNFRRVLHAFIFSFSIFGSAMECFSIKTLQSHIDSLQKGDWFVVDIDDTIITPQAMMFRPASPYCTFIDGIKRKSNIADIVSAWRLSRKVMLVEQEWPTIIEALKKRGVVVIALTQMHSGKFGKIPSMENWRADELRKLGITFNPFSTDTVETLIDTDEPATLFQGILFTGSHSKSDVLNSFIAKYGIPPKILFFDDRLHHVGSLGELCSKLNIIYEGYHYLATTQLPYSAEENHGAIQTQLILDGQWLEDEDVQKKQVSHG